MPLHQERDAERRAYQSAATMVSHVAANYQSVIDRRDRQKTDAIQLIDDIITRMDGKFNHMVYVGKNYTKSDVIDQLHKIRKTLER